MSLFTARGQDAKESAKKKKVDLSKAYIKLKDGENVRVRILGTADYVEYMAGGSYEKGIYTTPDISGIIGEPDPFTIAANSGVEGFEDLYSKKRYLFAFADIDAGEIRVFDASKTQGEKLMDLIDEYAESINDVGFSFKRSGTKIETSYNLIPIMKLKPNDQEKFDQFEGEEVPENYFESVLIPKSKEQKIEQLEKAGFPVTDFFGATKAKEEEEATEKISDETANF